MPAPAAALHPDRTVLTAFGLGRLDDKQRAAVEAHVASCDECCKALETVGGDSLVGLARAAMATPSQGGIEEQLDIPTPLLDHPRYKVMARLGAGGMGVVYKAEHKVMGRTVALKVLNQSTTSGPETIERFRREVRLASRMSHPNIVTAHDADEAGGLHFLVMEYVDGLSLDRLVAKKGPLPVPIACHYARQSAIGLQHAVSHGMIHRDIKPHNIMVTRKGQVKVLDFGLARIAAGDDTSRTAAGVTAPNLVVGTPDFLAPEQARNLPDMDHRADIYSLGCTLYFLLTGRPPFRGTSSFEKLIAHVQQEPEPVNSIRTEVPPGLVTVLAKMMAKNPEDRYQTPAEVAAALLPFVKTPPVPTPSTHLTAEVLVSTPSGGPVLVPVPVPMAPADTVPTHGLMTPKPSVVIAKSIVRTAVQPAEVDSPDGDAEDRPTVRKRKKKSRRSQSPFQQNKAAIVAILVAVIAVPLMTWAGYRLISPKRPITPIVAASTKPTTSPNTVKIDTATPQPPEQPKVGEPGFGPPDGPDPFGRPPENRPRFRPFGGKFGPPLGRPGEEPRGPRPGYWPKNVLMVLPPKDLYYTDYGPVRAAFEKGGLSVKTVSVTREPCTRHSATPGEPVKPDFAISEVTTDHLKDLSAVVFVGAGVDAYLPDGTAGKDVRRIIDDLLDNRRLVTAICVGVKVLGEHGVLGNHRAAKGQFYTCPGVDWIPANVVVDRSMITAGAAKDADEFAGRILEIIGPK